VATYRRSPFRTDGLSGRLHDRSIAASSTDVPNELSPVTLSFPKATRPPAIRYFARWGWVNS